MLITKAIVGIKFPKDEAMNPRQNSHWFNFYWSLNFSNLVLFLFPANQTSRWEAFTSSRHPHIEPASGDERHPAR